MDETRTGRKVPPRGSACCGIGKDSPQERADVLDGSPRWGRGPLTIEGFSENLMNVSDLQKLIAYGHLEGEAGLEAGGNSKINTELFQMVCASADIPNDRYAPDLSCF